MEEVGTRKDKLAIRFIDLTRFSAFVTLRTVNMYMAVDLIMV